MERYNRILHNDEFNRLLQRLDELESTRIFCRHGLTHLLDVCRISYIMVLENNLRIDKDIIYGAGLLHDIGRVAEYENGFLHDEESVKVARRVLKECGYSEVEIEAVCQAIAGHRHNMDYNAHEAESLSLAEVLKKADKLSRNCFCCVASDECKWNENQKNKGTV